MSEPFFDYIKNNLNTVSNKLYGYEEHEKKYFHVPYTLLPTPEDTNVLLSDVLKKRKSVRDFSTTTLEQNSLSSLLQLSIGKDEKNRGSKGYSFPSGGAFYPIETYLLVSNVAGLEQGLYHYSSVDHSLALLQKITYSVDSINKLFGMEFTAMPQVIVLMTMVKMRCIQKYGSLSYVLSLIEAGHRSQNIALCVNAFDMGCCSMGTTNYDEFNALLDIDGVNEHYIHSIALGLPSEHAKKLS